jgi:hypothetical protein
MLSARLRARRVNRTADSNAYAARGVALEAAVDDRTRLAPATSGRLAARTRAGSEIPTEPATAAVAGGGDFSAAPGAAAVASGGDFPAAPNLAAEGDSVGYMSLRDLLADVGYLNLGDLLADTARGHVL